MPKILVIDDEQTLIDEISDTLTHSGYEVSVSLDGQAGLASAQMEKPDLILCDVNMPTLDGYETLSHLRQLPEMARIPFIFMTGAADLKAMRHAMELGADDYIAKPFSVQELLSAINTRLKRHQDIIRQQEAEIERIKQQLMMMVSHELRTPLVSIMGVGELIETELDDLEPEELQNMMRVLNRGSQRLHQITEKILLFTQLESGLGAQEIWEVLDLPGLIQLGIDKGYRLSQRPQNEVQVVSAIPAVALHCYPDLLIHALGEVVANALNFSRNERPAELSLQAGEQQLRISIQDYGVGIDPQQIAKALQPFRQLNRDRQEQQGIGIGLSLVSRVMELHQGTLTLHSRPGEGTQVQLTLPLA